MNQEEDSKKLLKQKLKEDYNLSLKHLNLKYNKYQKPYLNLPVYFNISHSSNLVALVISKYDVGIDLEKIQARKKRLADKILSENELKEYQENKSNSYLIKKWTEKEAYFKLLGTGLILKDLRKDYSKFVKTYEVKDKENHYYLSIATKEKNNINVLEESIKI
ncbi:MAG: 4'-phosphopantetheinyl transferase family protein [Bacilli bacterium]